MNKPCVDIDNWHEQRWSNFTCSLNDKLVDNGSKTFFSPAGNTYVRQKAVECCTKLEERPEMEEVKALLWGKVYELPAFEDYVRVTRNTTLTYLGTNTPLYLEYEPLAEDCGGSPDVINITSSNTVDFLTEIKCPKNPLVHYDRLKWKDQWDIKENYREVYTQLQNLMMITGALESDFVSYDGRQLSKSHRTKIIRVKQDKKFQDNLHFRLIKAVEEKYKSISEHLGITVTSKSEFKRSLR